MTEAPPSEAGLLKTGQIFAGKYRIVRYLAKGAMGAVFVGQHVMTELHVAIKILFAPQDPRQSVEQTLTEAKIASRVRSDNIVQVQDAGVDEATQQIYIVMELLEGKTLEKLVETAGPLSPSDVVAYLRQVASGLDKAHNYKTPEGVAQPIVHRDLKPENLFLAHRDDGSPLVKILDFGIAKILSKETSKGTMQPKGTPLYMAPEQLSLKGIGPATDIWALGLIAFFLLTGKSYWLSAQDEEATVYSLFAEIGAPKEPASRRAAELRVPPPWPLAFDEWFARMLEPLPERRFSSATAAIDALAMVLGVLPQARPSSSQPQSVRGEPALPAPPQPESSRGAPVQTSLPIASLRAEALNASLPGGLSVQSTTEGQARWKPAVLGAVSSLAAAVALYLVLSRPDPAQVASASAASAAGASSSTESPPTVPPALAVVAPSASAAASATKSPDVPQKPGGLPPKTVGKPAKNPGEKPPPAQGHAYNPLD